MKRQNKVNIDFSSRADLRECLDRAAHILLQNSKVLAGIDQDRTVQRKTRLALLRLSSLIKRRWKESLNEGTRVELRIFLENMRMDSIHLLRALSDKRLVKALQLPTLREDIRHELHQFLNAQSKLSNDLRTLSSSIPSVVAALQLSGKRGHSGPFAAVQVSPKVLVSIYGRKLFTELGITKRAPSPRREMFVDFLDSIWTMATGGSDVEDDWSTSVKIAALQRGAGSSPAAHLSARFEAGDFVQDLLRNLGIGRARGALIAPNTSC